MAQQRGSKAPDLQGYVEVKDRIAAFHKTYPQGTIRTRLFEDGMPFRIQLMRQMFTDENTGQTSEYEQQFIVVVAEVQREPGQEWFVGSSYEPYPGRTPYTRYSELENAETSAWGRALAAVGIGVDKSIASHVEVRNRQAEREEPSFEKDEPPKGRARGRASTATRTATPASAPASTSTEAASPAAETSGLTVRPSSVEDCVKVLLSIDNMDDLMGYMGGYVTAAMRSTIVPPNMFRAPDGAVVTVAQLATIVKNDLEEQEQTGGERL